MGVNWKRLTGGPGSLFVLTTLLTSTAFAQYGGSGNGGSGGASPSSPASVYDFHRNYHLGFDKPEAWGLKYFTSTSLLSGLMPPETEGHRTGSVTFGFEIDWLPDLNAGQRNIGFGGRVPEDLNKAPIFARPVVRIGLPAKFSLIAAAPPPFEVFGVTSRLLALGIERPIVERPQWTLSWRGYGQIGHVRGSFTCPDYVLRFAPGTPGNPTECLAESNDTAGLRYAGMEFGFAHKLRSMPKIMPHAAVGGNFIDGYFHVHAQVADGLDETHLWTRGGTFHTSGGVTYAVTKRAAFTVDVFYSPLWVQRVQNGPTQNDGLFNVRALMSYTFR